MDWQITTTDKIVVSVGILVIIGMFSGYKVTINYTDSIPKGLYFIQNEVPGKGDYTLITKQNLLDFATGRGYIADGSYIGKKIVGTPGDTVVVSSKGVYVNSKEQVASQPIKVDRNNRSMPHNIGTQIIKENEVFLLGETKDSFDSRYYGTIKAKYLKGTLIPIITF
ncbi:signal peptidase I/conjugative transfer signal peptidase TraF,TIGR02771 [Fodinibius roseus]|uniref:Signal peptidase I/conjugative transfer signal peptidase TraF,TIGR02771 n=1 Tax=Fodinibius roseus TaxID=1194090 RepID=A0A1M5KND8_9BACT|nr:S26 family signal peptidase [Fodinibius roseus]SHG54344.1 signal peptidase I/conjugative transfer signal peptidase TraF,TIGR02771 [Fodinibius roseus]